MLSKYKYGFTSLLYFGRQLLRNGSQKNKKQETRISGCYLVKALGFPCRSEVKEACKVPPCLQLTWGHALELKLLAAWGMSFSRLSENYSCLHFERIHHLENARSLGIAVLFASKSNYMYHGEMCRFTLNNPFISTKNADEREEKKISSSISMMKMLYTWARCWIQSIIMVHCTSTSNILDKIYAHDTSYIDLSEIFYPWSLLYPCKNVHSKKDREVCGPPTAGECLKRRLYWSLGYIIAS